MSRVLVLNLLLLLKTHLTISAVISEGPLERSIVTFKQTQSFLEIAVNNNAFIYSKDCFVATADLDFDCALPSKCKPIYRTVKKYLGLRILVCLGHNGKSDGDTHRVLSFFPLIADGLVTKHVVWATIPKGKYLFVPKDIIANIPAVAHHEPIIIQEKDTICVLESLHSIALKFLFRAPEVAKNVANSWSLLRNAHIPLLFLTERLRLCDGVIMDKPNCTLIPINETTAVCQNVWFYPNNRICPEDYKLKTFSRLDLSPSLCTNVKVVEKTSNNILDDSGWLATALKHCINWFFTLTEVIAEFIISVLTFLLQRVLREAAEVMKQLSKLFDVLDEDMLVFESIVFLTIIAYRSNIYAAILALLCVGQVFGLDRTSDFSLRIYLIDNVVHWVQYFVEGLQSLLE